MTATAAQILRIRRMTSEPTTETYSDAAISAMIEDHPLMDENGSLPYTWSGSLPPEKEANTSWSPTYDLNAAAADIWEEKAAAIAALYDFNADGGSYSRSQRYEQYQKMIRYYRSRQSTKTGKLIKHPDESATLFPWIGNLPESD